MNITVNELLNERHEFGPTRQQMVRDGIAYAKAKHVTLQLVEAVASRETGMKNIVGDGGHGRGFVQIDDRFHSDWLRAHAGCKNGTTDAVFDSAAGAGHVPTIFAGTVFFCEFFEDAIKEAERLGIPNDGSRTRFALAAWNAGIGGATDGWKRGNLDLHTAHGDYSADTMERYHTLEKH